MARVTQRAKHARKGQRAARKLSAVSRGRRSAGKKPPRRSGNPARTRAKSKSRARQHTFVASHHRPDAFEQGLRRYAHYRDLGIAGATGGMVRAHVIKMIPPCDPAEVSKRHFHDVEFQMVYVLKGWIKANTTAPAWLPCAKVRAGCSRQRSSTPCSTIPTIANSSRSSCPRISQPSNWNDRIGVDRVGIGSFS